MPQPPEVAATRDELLRLYAASWADIEAELVDLASDPAMGNRARRRRRLADLARSIDSAMGDLDGEARAWLQTRFPSVYQLGASDAGVVTGRRFAWEQIHRDAVQELAADTFDDLLSATRFVRRDTKRFIREVARARTRAAIVEGQTATQAGRDLAAILQDRFAVDGISAVRYKNGARHGLADYADVLMRTRTAVAYSTGTINASVAAGVGWLEVADGADCGWTSHQDADKASGTIRSAADCAAHTISHPRCARAFAPRPDVKSGNDAKASAPLSDDERARRAFEERARASAQDSRRRAMARRQQRAASRRASRGGAR